MKVRSVVSGVFLLAACSPSSDNRPGRDSSAGAAPVIPPPPAVAVSPSQFSQLKWVEGSWRGTLPNGAPFFERYMPIDDSTLAMHSFPDSTFATATDSARVQLRADTVRNQGRNASWVVTKWDSTRVDFAPEWGATNTIVWQRDRNAWNATIETVVDGKPSIVTYRMERIR